MSSNKDKQPVAFALKQKDNGENATKGVNKGMFGPKRVVTPKVTNSDKNAATASMDLDKVISRLPGLLLIILKLFPRAMKAISIGSVEADGTLKVSITFSVLGAKFTVDVHVELDHTGACQLAEKEVDAPKSDDKGASAIEKMLINASEKWKASVTYKRDAYKIAKDFETMVAKSASKQLSETI